MHRIQIGFFPSTHSFPFFRFRARIRATCAAVLMETSYALGRLATERQVENQRGPFVFPELYAFNVAFSFAQTSFRPDVGQNICTQMRFKAECRLRDSATFKGIMILVKVYKLVEGTTLESRTWKPLGQNNVLLVIPELLQAEPIYRPEM